MSLRYWFPSDTFQSSHFQRARTVLNALLSRGVFSLDVLWPLLRGGEPLQNAANLLGEDHRHVQREEKT